MSVVSTYTEIYKHLRHHVIYDIVIRKVYGAVLDQGDFRQGLYISVVIYDSIFKLFCTECPWGNFSRFVLIFFLVLPNDMVARTV